MNLSAYLSIPRPVHVLRVRCIILLLIVELCMAWLLVAAGERNVKKRSADRRAALSSYTSESSSFDKADQEHSKKFRENAKDHLEEVLGSSVKGRTVFQLGVGMGALELAKVREIGGKHQEDQETTH